ncbi:MAG: hypothetical protein IT236_09935 [Bacteroidia bacterium]|nr:hypothetical protein [Bacteroidia bacterium]
MKRHIILFSTFMILAGISVLSCGKKKSSGISPTYSTTAGGNPNPNVPTVTGNATPTNPATENTFIQVGGSGWSNPTCGTTNSLSLKGFNGSIDVTLSFASTIPVGSNTFAVGAAPGAGIVGLSILNAPNQPAGIVWYGKSGSVVVNATASNINANFNGVVCTQASFNFPSVTASGFLSCAQ